MEKGKKTTETANSAVNPTLAPKPIGLENGKEHGYGDHLSSNQSESKPDVNDSNPSSIPNTNEPTSTHDETRNDSRDSKDCSTEATILHESTPETHTETGENTCPEVASASHSPVLKDDLEIAKRLKHTKAAMESWIENNFNGSNISALLSQLPEEEKFENLRNDLQILCDVTNYLNLELLNMFDNYVCFAGHEDKSQLTRLSSMASIRAKAALDTETCTDKKLVDQLFEQVSQKLCRKYADENDKIAIAEQSIAGHVTTKICNAYSNQIEIYKEKGNTRIDNYHARLSQYSLEILDRILDSSAKVSNIHAHATGSLEDKLNQVFSELKQTKCSKTVNLDSKHELLSKFEERQLKLTRKQFNGAIAKYHETINANLSNQKDCNALKILHEKIAKTFGTNLALEDSQKLRLQIQRYFAHACNVFEVKNTKNEGILNCLAVHVRDGEICLSGINKLDEEGWHSVNNLEEFCQSLKTLIPKISQLLKTQKTVEILNNEEILLPLLRRVNEVAKLKCSTVKQICIIIPTWFKHREISELRNITLKANFERTYCIRESCVWAYKFAKDTTTEYETFVFFKEHDSNIYVDIFQIQNNKTIQLVSLAELEEEDSNKSEGIPGSTVNFAGEVKSAFCATSSGLCDRNLQRIGKTFETALSGLSEQDRNTDKGCIFVCSQLSFKQAFESFVQDKTRCLFKLPLPLKMYDTLHDTLVSLATNPSQITSNIIDFVVPASEQYVSQHVGASIPPKLRKTSVNSEKKAKLLKKCRLIKAQLEAGNVRLGVLTVEVVTDLVNKAEQVAKNSTASDEDISEQSAKVEDIIKKHEIKLKQ